MMRLPVFDKNGKRTKEILEIDDTIFGDRVRQVLLKEVVLMYEARQRVGTHSTKGRAECAGSQKKLWRQKGTGRARVGSARAPHWRGGGIVFGPKPRDYSYSLPKKARRAAHDSAWLTKLRDKDVMVIEEFDFEEPKSKKLLELLRTMGVNKSKVAIALDDTNDNVWKSSRNLSRVSADILGRTSTYTLLSHDKIIITKKAFENLVSSREGNIESLDRDKIYVKS